MERKRHGIAMPDRAQRLYMESEYFWALERAGGDRAAALQMEEERGCGFGFVYIDAVHRALDTTNNAQLRRLQQEIDELDQETDAKTVCDMINFQFENVRLYACRVLNDYVRRRGCIDAWPTPNVSAGLVKYGRDENGKKEGVKVKFGLFAPNFTYARQGDMNIISRKGEPMVHRFSSSIPRPKELTDAEARARELRGVKKPTMKQRRWNIIKQIISILPAGLMLSLAAVVLFCMLTGTELGKNAGLLAVLLEFMGSNMFVFLSLFSGMVVSGLIASLVLRLILSPEKISREDVRIGQKAREELERIENDPRYDQMQKAWQRRRREEEQMVGAWTKEWFEVCMTKQL